ncbi:MAG: hypothetical protein Q8W44_00295 [Candidatus Palauibacterales bacterium]|nr:hypothetical protein [Candidatus Palauibacterales bacterium]
MADTTLILHGWSDCSESFRSLESFLVEEGVGEVESIYYADYESREDAITYEDVVGGLDDELRRRGLLDERGRGSFDVVVHSTGGMVIRHWIWRYYGHRIDDCPVENLVMLAPANFGSPLAHRGKSLLGRVFGGRWKIGDMLEVGRRLLDGLELGSAHQWELAHRDLLGPEPLYDADRVRLTVLVGLSDYSGLRGWVPEKPGTDGAVVIAGTPLDSVKLSLDFCDPSEPRRWRRDTAHGAFAFGTLPGHDHGSIVEAFGAEREADRESPDRPGRDDGAVRELVLSALRVDSPGAFRQHRDRVHERREAARASVAKAGAAPTRWQQFLFHAVDDQDQPVRDFTLEFFVHRRGRETRIGETRRGAPHGPRMLTSRERELSNSVNRRMTAHFHTYSRDPSFRRALVDVAGVEELLPDGHVLAMRMYVPRVEDGIYYDTDHLRDVVVHDPSGEDGADGGSPSFLHPDTTTLVQLRVDRVTDYVTVDTRPREH